ncbi:MAG: Rpn family recombination-promoting nuclease/putative transposase [Alphaproteobacteria bacterium]|jgi:predicted transposase/invertase (TIGR01784 family)|nr:Rpn family recombination-promoting nuclease/putative transposase [Alphaproteobacteria bacterium]
MKYSKYLFVSFLLILVFMVYSLEASSNPLRGFEPFFKETLGLLRHCTHRATFTIAKPGRLLHSTTGQLKEVDDKETDQIFGIPTYDSAFRYMLTSDDVRLDFVQTFAKNLDIISTETLNHNLSPIKEFTELRDILNTKKTASLMHRISKGELYIAETNSTQKQNGDTQILSEFAHHFNDLRDAFPRPLKAAQMDLTCRLSDGHHAIVAVQVVPQDFLDRRALAYAALYFDRQLRSGDNWGQLQKVIAISILGGGKSDMQRWVVRPKEVIKHYKFVDVLNPEDKIDGIELIQCSVLSKGPVADPKMREWVELFRAAHYKTWNDVDKVKSPVIREAYERLRMDKFPPDIMRQYNDQEYSRYSQHTAMIVKKAREEGLREGKMEEILKIASRMKNKRISLEEIMKMTGLRESDISKL